MKSLSCVQLFTTPCVAAYKALRPWGFPGKSTGVGCHCLLQSWYKNKQDFPGGPVVKNSPSNAGDTGSTPSHGTKIPHASGQLSRRPTATSHSSRACEPQILKLMCPGAHAQQLESNPCCTRLARGSREQRDRLQRESPEITAYSV